jgi:hypothetical protein
VDEPTLQHGLAQLVDAELVYQRGLPPQATYLFKHALIQDTAYQSLLKSTRQQYHQRIAQVLEAHFPENVESQPELLAQHYTEAGLHAQAVDYWQQAGQRASEGSAYVEAIEHLTKGLEVLTRLPSASERAGRELLLQLTLGAPPRAIRFQKSDRPTRGPECCASKSGRRPISPRRSMDCGYFLSYGGSYGPHGSWPSSSSPWPKASTTLRCCRSTILRWG